MASKNPSFGGKILLSGETGGGIYMSLNGVETTIVDENGNVDAPVTSTNLTLSGTLDVAGVATFSDEILVGTNASVGDTLIIGNELGVSSNVTVGGNLTVGGTTIVNGVVADPLTFEDVATFEVAPVLEAGAEFDGPLYTTGGAVSVTPEAEQAVVTVAGAIALTSYNHLIDTTGGVLALTLAAPAMPRQRIRLQMIVDGGGSTNDATLTFNGTATIVFADEGDYVELQHNGAEWIPVVLVNLQDNSIPVYTPA